MILDPSAPEKTAVSWLKYVNDWLYELDENSALSDPAKLLLEKLKQAREKNESKQAWDIINDLRRLSDNSEDRESAEIRLECGLVAAEMDNFRDALRLFQDASSKYTNFHHQRAIVLWMIGCAQWLLPDREVDAINSWRDALKRFHALREHNKGNQNKSDWYATKCQLMSEALHTATEKYDIPPLPSDAQKQQKNGKSKQQNLALVNATNSFRRSVLKSLAIIGCIPAGTPVGMLPEEERNMGMDVVEIEDGKYYGIYSLRGEKTINLWPNKEYYILKVNGNSMNMAGPINICDGDYVLMVSQEATNGDIVAAEIKGIDALATLKHYRLKNGKPTLFPESDDPEFQKPLPDNNFIVRGVALAVFKFDDEYTSSH